MNKSLVPLIISFAVIILLSFIVIYSKPGASGVGEGEEGNIGKIRLSPFPVRRAKTAKVQVAQPQGKTYAPSSDKILEEARTFLAEGKEADAEDRLRTLLIFEPNNPQALSLLGGIMYYSSRYQEAEMIFRKQIQLDPDKAPLHNQLGSVLAKQDKITEAVAECLKAVDLEPDSADARINLAGMYSVSGDRDNAMKQLIAAYKLIGYRILPFTHDSAFDKIRQSPEFQETVQMARRDWEANLSTSKDRDSKVPPPDGKKPEPQPEKQQ